MINEDNLLEDLQEFMFSYDNLEKNTNKLPVSTKQKIHKKSEFFLQPVSKPIPLSVIKPIKRLDVFVPVQKDGLFWCLYVLTLGFGKYDMIGNQHFVEEKRIKFEYIELIRSKKPILKMNKIKPLTELEDDLANKEQIGLKTFISLCILMEINVLVVDKRKYYEFINDDSKIINIITKTEKPLKYSLDLNTSQEKIENYRNNYFKMITLDSNLKSITFYKMEDLLLICEKLGIEMNESNKKKYKKDLYELIIQNF